MTNVEPIQFQQTQTFAFITWGWVFISWAQNVVNLNLTTFISNSTKFIGYDPRSAIKRIIAQVFNDIYIEKRFAPLIQIRHRPTPPEVAAFVSAVLGVSRDWPGVSLQTANGFPWKSVKCKHTRLPLTRRPFHSPALFCSGGEMMPLRPLSVPSKIKQLTDAFCLIINIYIFFLPKLSASFVARCDKLKS